MSHPSSCHDPACTLSYREHLLSIGIGASALPTRKKAVIGTSRKEAAWERDMPAYRRLRRDGLQPPGIDGARALEQKAEHPGQVETGMTHVKPRAFDAFSETFGHKATDASRS